MRDTIGISLGLETCAVTKQTSLLGATLVKRCVRNHGLCARSKIPRALHADRAMAAETYPWLFFPFTNEMSTPGKRLRFWLVYFEMGSLQNKQSGPELRDGSSTSTMCCKVKTEEKKRTIPENQKIPKKSVLLRF